MGARLFEELPELVTQADEILGYSIRELCLGDAVKLRRTEYAQPALFVVSALAYLRRCATGPAPMFLAGHSLGELSALFAAGCIDFVTGLRIVRRRAELMGQATGGGMVAVLGVPLKRLTAILAADGIDGIEVANHNLPGQLVLAGSTTATRAVATALAAEGIGRTVPLNVSVAAHSSRMTAAAAEFAEFLRTVRFAEPEVPVIANVTARPHRGPEIADALSRHLTQPVRWWDTLCLLAQEGVDQVEEVGPGEVLTKMWQRAQPDLPPARPAAVRVGAPRDARVARDPLGSASFRRDYGTTQAYVAGSLGHGVSGPELLVRLADAGLAGFLGTAGRSPAEVAEDLRQLHGRTGTFGLHLPAGVEPPERVTVLVDAGSRFGLRHAEATAVGGITAELLRWRFDGARLLLVKVSRLAQAQWFLQPPPADAIEALRRAGQLSAADARAAARQPVATDVCVEADPVWLSGGAVGSTLLPAVVALRDRISADLGYPDPPRVGVGGGIGTPVAVAAAFLAAADFVLTGSVNQCSPQARTSCAAKDLLAAVDLDDTMDAPAGEFFELGGRGRVVRRGTLFGARAEALYRAYRNHSGLRDLDHRTRRSFERDHFGASLEQVWEQLRLRYPARSAGAGDPKRQMALVFRSYVERATRLALEGVPGEQLNYRIPCGPAMGAFNRYVADTLPAWHDRHVDVVATTLLTGARELLDRAPSASCGRR